ncbi:Zinc finger protein 714 [Plecturocebus cupreus]
MADGPQEMDHRPGIQLRGRWHFRSKQGQWLSLPSEYSPHLTLEVQGSGLPEVRSSRPDWLARRNPTSTKNTKIIQAWWWAPVTPATHEAEAGESLEPGRRRLHTLGSRGGQIMRSRNQDHPGQHGETPSLLKIQKLAGRGGAACSPSYSGG